MYLLSTKVIFEDTKFKSPTWAGAAILCGQYLSHAKV